MKRRIGQGWSAFCKLDNIMRDKNVPMRLKRKVFNECILPVMTYGCETWSLSNTQLEKLVTTQRKMERIMIGVTLKDRKSTEWIRKQSGLTDIIRSIRESKHRWAGHVARRRDNRWTIRITEWIPHGNKRPRGRPRTRWCDDLIQYVGPTWSHIARDRKLWQACREGFLLRERETPWVMNDGSFSLSLSSLSLSHGCTNLGKVYYINVDNTYSGKKPVLGFSFKPFSSSSLFPSDQKKTSPCTYIYLNHLKKTTFSDKRNKSRITVAISLHLSIYLFLHIYFYVKERCQVVGMCHV